MGKGQPQSWLTVAHKEFTTKRTDYMEFDDEVGEWVIKVEPYNGLFGLPADCPIRGIGTDEKNAKYYYLTAGGKVIELSPNAHNKQGIQKAFDEHINYLYSRFPKWKKIEIEGEDGKKRKEYEHDPDRFNVDNVAKLMMDDAAMETIEIHKIVRRIGCWKSEQGLIIHHGDCITEFNAHKKAEPITMGLHKYEGHVYVRHNGGDELHKDNNDKPIIPDPTKEEAFRAAEELIQTYIGTWNWKRKGLDPQLFFGMLIAAYFGGYFEWRSSCWIQGTKGTGKSTLTRFTAEFHNNACYQAVKPTEASARYALSTKTIPAMLDEQTNNDPLRQAAIHDLMRFGSSGASMTTAGPEGTILHYPIRSSFMMCGVILPHFEEQDLSRLTIFHLKPLDPKADPLTDDDFTKVRSLAEICRYYIARNFYEFEARDKHIRTWLKEQGLDARETDQLAAPITLTSWLAFDTDKPTSEQLKGYWIDLIDAYRLHQTESDWERCLSFIITSHIQHQTIAHNDVIAKENFSVAEIINKIHTAKDDNTNDAVFPRSDEVVRDEFLKTLQNNGMNITQTKDGKKYLFVPNSNNLVRNFFKGTEYIDKSKNMWKSALSECPGALSEKFKCRLEPGTNPVYGIAIPLHYIIGESQ